MSELHKGEWKVYWLYIWFPPMLCSIPMICLGISLPFRTIIWRSRAWSFQPGSFPSPSSLIKLPVPWCATSAVQILLILHPDFCALLVRYSHRSSYSSFGMPFAWVLTAVTSPGTGLGLSVGMYCFTARYNMSSWVSTVAWGKSLMC